VTKAKARFGGPFDFSLRQLAADSVEKLDSKIWPTKHWPRERGYGAVLVANYVESNSHCPTFAENWYFFRHHTRGVSFSTESARSGQSRPESRRSIAVTAGR
jgi:hypothetical protein